MVFRSAHAVPGGAGGVNVFNTGKGEVVVSVAWIADQGDDEDGEEIVATDPDA